jgi:hypothetical protein
VLPESDTPKEVSIATTLIPWRKDDYRARYMGYLACGFNPDEALYMLGLKLSWLEEQRQDEVFNSIEVRVPEIRKELSKEYIELDFFRNFRLVLEKDYRILKMSLDEDKVMGKGDHEYLLKLRSAYTPQQLAILGQVMRGVGASDFNFAKFVSDNADKIREARAIEVSRTDSVRIISGTSQIQEDSNH